MEAFFLLSLSLCVPLSDEKMVLSSDGTTATDNS